MSNIKYCKCGKEATGYTKIFFIKKHKCWSCFSKELKNSKNSKGVVSEI